MRAWSSSFDGLSLRLAAGWFRLPAYLVDPERQRLLDLIAAGVEDIEHIVELDWATLADARDQLQLNRALVLVRIPASEEVDEQTLRALGTRLGGVRVGLWQHEAPGVFAELAWQERAIKVPLLAWLERALVAPGHPLAQLDIHAVPLDELAALTPEPVELLVMLEQVIGHRMRYRAQGVGPEDWRRSIVMVAAARFAARLRAIPAGEQAAALELVITRAGAAFVPAHDQREGGLALARVGLALHGGSDLMLGPLVRFVAQRERLPLLLDLVPTHAWSRTSRRALRAAMPTVSLPRAILLIPEPPYSRWPAIVPELPDALAGLPAAFEPPRASSRVPAGRRWITSFLGSDRAWWTPSGASAREPGLDGAWTLARGLDDDRRLELDVERGRLHRFEAIDRAWSGPEHGELRAYLRWFALTRLLAHAHDQPRLDLLATEIERALAAPLEGGRGQALRAALFALLGDVHARRARYREALRAWEQAFALLPASDLLPAWLDSAAHRLSLRRAFAHLRLAQVDAARALAEGLEPQADPTNTEVAQALDELLDPRELVWAGPVSDDFDRGPATAPAMLRPDLLSITQAAVALERGDWPRAAELVRSFSIDLDTLEGTRAQILWAILRGALGDRDGAAACFAALRELGEDRGDALLVALSHRGQANLEAEGRASSWRERALELEGALGLVDGGALEAEPPVPAPQSLAPRSPAPQRLAMSSTLGRRQSLAKSSTLGLERRAPVSRSLDADAGAASEPAASKPVAGPPAVAPLVVLHLSDLHFGPHSRFADQDPTALAERFAIEVREARSAADLGGVDLVVVTGDVTEAARKREFEQAGEFFAVLARSLDLPRQRFCFVQGNHDVSWAHCKLVRVHQELEEFDDAELERRLQVEKSKLWHGFVREFYGRQDFGAGERRELGAGAFVQDFEALHVSVVALDSCARETDRVHGGFIGEEQARAAMDEWIREARQGWIKIVAVHHNPVVDADANIRTWVAWLGDQAEAGKLKASDVAHFASDAVGFEGRARVQAIAEDTHAQLVLHGHVHAAGHASWSWTRGVRGQTQIVGAGSWGLGDHKLPRDQPVMFQLLALDPVERELRIHRRVWEPRARMSGQTEPGTFVADPAMPAAGLGLDVGVPEAVVERLQRAQPAAVAAPATALATAPAEGPISEAELGQYLRMAATMHDRVPLVGFNVKARLSLQLEDLHVPLDAIIDRGNQGREVYASAELARRAKDQGGELRQEQLALADAFVRARVLRRRGLVLLGDPGSGKTTHLKQVLLQVVAQGPESIGLPAGTTPVLLSLRGLKDLAAGLPGLMRQQLGDPLLRLSPDFGERLCKRGKLLLLLDGLDEVASAEQRAEVARWIERAHDADADTFILVSCRYAGYADDAELGASFLELHLRPLSDEQMASFVRNWYGLVEGELTPDREQAKIKAAAQAEELLAVLATPQYTSVARVYEMTRNPLLLTAICLVHYDRGRLPDARAKLYEDAISVLLERWRQRRGQSLLGADDALRILRPVAAWMHSERERRQASGAELRGPVQEALSSLRGVELDAETFLRDIRDHSGLLTGWGVDEYGFMHLGFQEFLTARHLRNAGLKDELVFVELAGEFEDSWWQEVILLMLAQRDPSVFDAFMGAVVDRPEFARGWSSEMMQLCLREAGEPSAAPFEALLRRAAPAERAAELGERQLAAAKLLKREGLLGEGELAELVAGHPARAVQVWWGSTRPTREVIVARRGGVELVRIPAGRFMMGTAQGWGDDDERPRHEVELAEFYLARTPVTNAQYGQYLAAKPDADKPAYWADRRFNQPDQPVVGVSWHEAMAYCEWAGLVLPTEAQWEYACRAGTQTQYWSGDSEDDLARVGWYDGNSGGRLHPVAEKEPNAFGLHDVHGNVWEWCLDQWGSYTTSPRSSDGLRHEPVGDANRVRRGGSFSITADVARSAYRYHLHPVYRSRNLGFRVAQAIP